MLVGLNLLFVEPGGTGGMETYARELVQRLPSAMPEASFVAFGGRELAEEWSANPWHPDIRFSPLPVNSETRIRRSLVEQLLLPVRMRGERLGLVHHLTQTAPALSGCPSVVTVHDLIYREFPETHSSVLSKGVAALVPVVVRHASRVLVPSEATARSVETELGFDRDSIDVVPEGPGRISASNVTAEMVDAIRTKLDVAERPIVLSVSARRPHKNLGRLISAMAVVPEAVLVLPGYPSPFDQEILDAAEAAGVSDRVCLCGWLDDGELEALYSTAACMAFPSLAEGFGLPVLEAMARGLPVATSNLSAMPEVAGDAALFFDPLSVPSISSSVNRLLADGQLRDELRELGLAQAKRFSWERAAQGTADSYRRALGA